MTSSLPKPELGTGVNPNNPLSKGLLAWYPFIQAERLIDYSIHENDAAISSGCTWSGAELIFPGANNNATMSKSLGSLSAFTIIFMVRVENFPHLAGADSSDNFAVSRLGGDMFFWHDNLSVGVTEVSIASLPSLSQPQSIAFTWDGQQTGIWVNGVKYAGEAATGTMDLTGLPIVLGFVPSKGGSLIGGMEDVKIYDYGLGAQELISLYENPDQLAWSASEEPIWLLIGEEDAGFKSWWAVNNNRLLGAN